MTPEELKQLFDNKSDCYADSHEVIPAMTRERFVEVVSKLIGSAPVTPEPEVVPPDDWIPASEPPNNARDVIVALSDGREFYGCYGKIRELWFIHYGKIIGVASKTRSVASQIRPGDTVVSWKEIK